MGGGQAKHNSTGADSPTLEGGYVFVSGSSKRPVRMNFQTDNPPPPKKKRKNDGLLIGAILPGTGASFSLFTGKTTLILSIRAPAQGKKGHFGHPPIPPSVSAPAVKSTPFGGSEDGGGGLPPYPPLGSATVP